MSEIASVPGGLNGRDEQLQQLTAAEIGRAARAPRPSGRRRARVGSVAAPLVALFLAGCASAGRAEPSASPASAGAPPASAGSPAGAPVEAHTDASGGRLQWRGGPTAILERDGLRLLTDPVLGPRGPAVFVLPRHPSTGVENAPIARYTDPPAEPLGRLDLILLSHNHADHFDAVARETLPKDVTFILPPDAVEAARAAGFTRLTPLDWDAETVIPTRSGRLRILAVPANHSHDAALDATLGKGNGYVLRWEGAAPYSVYWTGDAVFTEPMRAVAARFAPIDLWLPHLGAVGVDGGRGLRTMDAEEAVAAAALLRARHVIPIHHTTFGHYREPVTAFVQRASTKSLPAHVHVPTDGAWMSLPR
ncbi:MBL fold metallo-hydrolase [Sorangium sp. So ce1182]|uniref:MBL fold metallo-hydrolase n=1 Tax=Sorangium sp. So ce1182 TaxID=3133334 RepID=UPI003F5DA033